MPMPKHVRGGKSTIPAKFIPPQVPQSKKQIPRSLSAKKSRIYVLDTNVIMHDPTSLLHFQEHDVVICQTVLEELDNHKNGREDKNRNVRQALRLIWSLVDESKSGIKEGVSLKDVSKGASTGRLLLGDSTALVAGFVDTPDNRILSLVKALKEQYPAKDVVLVSKDINLLIKACTLSLKAEDYRTDAVVEDTDYLYSGRVAVKPSFFSTHLLASKVEGLVTVYTVRHPSIAKMTCNEFVHTVTPNGSIVARLVEKSDDTTGVFRSVLDYGKEKHAVSGITARNTEQMMALDLLLDPHIDIVTLVGDAGCGKTLLALACGVSETVDSDRFVEILVTRATVSVGEDIGFLPGNESEKMGPWMGAFDDNVEVLSEVQPNMPLRKGAKSVNIVDVKSSAASARVDRRERISSHISVRSMNFMRGRTFLNKFVIIDEAQNLTPKQMKTLITRAGPGTKIVCLGNLSQIDTPYLTEGSSGLTYLVERFRGWKRGGHVTLVRGERSPLATYANEVL